MSLYLYRVTVKFGQTRRVYITAAKTPGKAGINVLTRCASDAIGIYAGVQFIVTDIRQLTPLDINDLEAVVYRVR